MSETAVVARRCGKHGEKLGPVHACVHVLSGGAPLHLYRWDSIEETGAAFCAECTDAMLSEDKNIRQACIKNCKSVLLCSECGNDLARMARNRGLMCSRGLVN